MSSILENIARDLGPARAYRLTVGPEGRSELPREAPSDLPSLHALAPEIGRIGTALFGRSAQDLERKRAGGGRRGRNG